MCDTGPLRAEPGSSSTRLRRPSRPGAKRHLETVGADRDHPRAAGPVHAGPVRWDEPVQVRPGASRGMVSLCSGTFKRASSVRSPQGSASAFWNVWTLSCPPGPLRCCCIQFRRGNAWTAYSGPLGEPGQIKRAPRRSLRRSGPLSGRFCRPSRGGCGSPWTLRGPCRQCSGARHLARSH